MFKFSSFIAKLADINAFSQEIFFSSDTRLCKRIDKYHVCADDDCQKSEMSFQRIGAATDDDDDGYDELYIMMMMVMAMMIVMVMVIDDKDDSVFEL